MIGVIASMVAGACFFSAGMMHHERGETVQAERCAIMVVISLGCLLMSAAFA